MPPKKSNQSTPDISKVLHKYLVDRWMYYVLSQVIVLYCDHQALRYLNPQRKLALNMLAGYSFFNN